MCRYGSLININNSDYYPTDLPMQLNLGIFEYNRRSGFLRKPIFMCREDRMFDPFTDTSVDGIIPGKVSIQVGIEKRIKHLEVS